MPKELKKVVGYKIAGKGEIPVEFYPLKPILLEHNKSTYEKIKEAFEYADKVALVQATGTGKSFLAIQWLADNLEEGEKAVYLAPNENIANQFKKHIKQCGLAEKLNDVKIILYPSLQSETLSLLSTSTNVDYIVADEFHRLGATTWNPAYLEFLENNPEAKVLGLSATPIRHLDNERDMAKELFEETVEGINLVEAIKQGHIPTPDYVRGIISYSEKLEDLYKKLKYVKKEDVKQQIEKEIKRLKRNIEQAGGLEQLFGEYIEKKDGKYILFCSDLTHLHEVKSMIQNGLFGQVNKAVEIYDVSYQKTDKQVEREIDKFETSTSNALKIMLSVELLNEGVHVEGIDGCIMMRRTISPRIYLQQLGRALSVGKEKSPLIIDVVENYESLQAFGSFFEREEDYSGEGGEIETVLPFRVKGEAVENEKFISQIEDLIYQSMGPKGWLMLAEEYYKENGDLAVPEKLKLEGETKGNPLYAWLKNRKKEYKEYLEDKTKYQDKAWIFEELYKMDPNWYADRSFGNEGYIREMIEALKQYYELNGDLAVPCQIEIEGETKNNSLYTWLKNRKKEYIEYLKNRTKYSDKEWIFEELFAIDPYWYNDRSPGNEKFTLSRLEELKLYCKETGDLCFPKKIKSENGEGKVNTLYDWLLCKKREYRAYLKDNTKNQNKVWIFNELFAMDPNWHIDRSSGNETFTRTMLEELKKYFKLNGDLALPAVIVSEEGQTKHPLYQWFARQKREYRLYLEDNTKYQNKVWLFNELSAMDPDWHVNRSKGNEASTRRMLDELKRYHAVNGEISVPQHLKINGETKPNPLYDWLRRRREEYRLNLKDNKKYQDKAWIFDELSAMDPNWYMTGYEAFTCTMLEELRQYYIINGDLAVPCEICDHDKRIKTNPQYSWLKTRKTEYREHLQDKEKYQDKVWLFEELSAMDPDWHVDKSRGNETSVRVAIEELKQYYEANGDLSVPTKIKDKEGKMKKNLLYKWLDARKIEYKKYLEDNSKYQTKVWIFEELSAMDPDWYLTRAEKKAKKQEQIKEDEDGIENE